MITAGIDPGKTGAVAILNTYQKPARLEVRGLSVDSENRVPCDQIIAWLFEHSVEAVVIEEVHSMPKQGVASTFKFGMIYGQCIGMLTTAGLPWVKVPPQVWKRHLGLTGQGKDGSRAAAKELFEGCEDRLTSHDKCEAALLAWWGWKSRQASGEKPPGEKIIRPNKPGLIIP